MPSTCSYFIINDMKLRSVFKCSRICVCGMQPVLRKSCGSRYTVFVHMRVHTVCMWVHAVNIQIHVVNIQVHAVYNVIVKYFFIILYLKIIKNQIYTSA
jgi:hypothetical protein